MPHVKTEVNKESSGLVHYFSQLSGYTVRAVYRGCIELFVGAEDTAVTLGKLRDYLKETDGPPPHDRDGSRKVG